MSVQLYNLSFVLARRSVQRQTWISV